MKPEITAGMAEQEVLDLQDGWRGTDEAKSPLGQWLGLKELENHRKDFDGGDEPSLVWALFMCLKHGLAAPEWVEGHIVEGIHDLLMYRKRSWDEVLPRLLPKGGNLNARRKELELRVPVYCDVESLKSMGRAIGPDLFEAVGEKYGFGKTRTEELYYEGKKLFPLPPSR
ncbi:MAG: hypothetical protein HY941_03990 [Gammaproteobacteria bacterium]|nr:hypothetical protein [Gammaproteobacteria bacterium]